MICSLAVILSICICTGTAVYLKNFIATCSICRTLYHLYIFVLLYFYRRSVVRFCTLLPVRFACCFSYLMHNCPQGFFRNFETKKTLALSIFQPLTFAGFQWHYLALLYNAMLSCKGFYFVKAFLSITDEGKITTDKQREGQPKAVFSCLH